MLSNCPEMLILGTYWKDLIFHGQWTNLHDRLQKWTKACDKRLSRLISYIHHTCEYKQYCYVGNTTKQCRTGTVSRLRFCRRSWGLKIYVRRNIVRFFEVIHLFPISWMCEKQTAVSHSSTESENHFFGCRIEVGWVACSWFIWSDRCSSWEHESEPYITGRLDKEQTGSSFATSHDLQTQAISDSDQWLR